MNMEDFKGMKKSDLPNGKTQGEKGLKPLSSSLPDDAKVYEKTIHTITVLRVYPNGDTFVVKEKSYSWIQGNVAMKKKQPKKKKELKQAKLQQEETW